MKIQKESNIKKQTVKFTLEISAEEAQKFYPFVNALDVVPDEILAMVINLKLTGEK